MPSVIQSDFTGGEWAPEYGGRTDQEKYKSALALARNAVVLPHGGATRRPGFLYVAGAKNGQTTPVRLIRFAPTLSASYRLEFGPGYIRFFRKRKPVLSSGVPFEVATSYAAGEIAQLYAEQQGASLYLFHPAHKPAILTWSGSDTGFALADASFTDGPYLDPITGGTTLTPTAAGSSVTLNASAQTGINGGAGFLSGDGGRHIRMLQQTLGLTFIGGTVQNYGTNYAVGDTITLAGGTFIRPAVLTVTAIGAGGAITSADVSDSGAYLVTPAGSIGQAATTGLGTGVAVTPGWIPYNDAAHLFWAWGTISAVVSATQITVTLGTMVLDVTGTTLAGYLATTQPITNWRLGAWSVGTGYPAAGHFFGARLLAGGVSGGGGVSGKRLWGTDNSASPAVPLYTSFRPSLASGQVVEANGLDVTLDDEEGDAIAWLSASGKAQIPQVAVGTTNAEHLIEPSPTGAALTPTALQHFRETRYTNAPLRPLRIGRALIFADRARQRLRKWVYQFMVGGYVGPEVQPMARHLLLSGVAAMDYALTPHPVIWLAMQDGSLAGITYQLDEGEIEAAHSHQLGGSYYGGPPLVLSLCVGPSEDPTPYDEVWAVVDRADAAGTSRTIEVMAPYFRAKPLSEAIFVDSAITSSLTFPAATCTPALGPFQPSGNALLPAAGDSVTFAFSGNVAVAGDLDPGTVLRIDNGTFRLTAVNSATSVTCECMDPPTKLEPQPANGWSYTKMATSFTGFAAFNGRTVQVLGDGALYGSQTVSGGTVTLASPASYIAVGYACPFWLETLDLDLPAPDGTSQMKTGRLDHLYLRLLETAGGYYGTSAAKLDAIEPRGDDDLGDWAPAMRSTCLPGALLKDDLRVAMPGGSSTHRRVVVNQPDPWPITVVALVTKGRTTEMSPAAGG